MEQMRNRVWELSQENERLKVTLAQIFKTAGGDMDGMSTNMWATNVADPDRRAVEQVHQLRLAWEDCRKEGEGE